METNKIYNEPCLETLRKMPDKFLDCVITSPPYWQLRDYGYNGQWGLEPTFQEYLENLWSMMDQIYRVLKDNGTVWINLGDTYNKNKCLLLLPHRFAKIEYRAILTQPKDTWEVEFDENNNLKLK